MVLKLSKFNSLVVFWSFLEKFCVKDLWGVELRVSSRHAQCVKRPHAQCMRWPHAQRVRWTNAQIAETLAYLSVTILMDYLLQEPRYLHVKFVWRIASILKKKTSFSHKFLWLNSASYLKKKPFTFTFNLSTIGNRELFTCCAWGGWVRVWQNMASADWGGVSRFLTFAD